MAFTGSFLTLEDDSLNYLLGLPINFIFLR